MELLAIDIIGHVGYASLMCGMYLLSLRKKSGWIFRLAGEAIWLILGVALGLSSIWVWGILFIVIDLYGYMNWRNSE